MRHAKHKKGKDRVTATILLCFCLIALTSIFTVQSSINKINDRAKNLPASRESAVEKTLQDSSASEKNETSEGDAMEEKTGAADLPVSKPFPVVDSAAEEEVKDQTYLPPVNLTTASVVKEYSMDMVIYNKTLDQYMTHPGIDFEAPSGSGVNAIADGTVTAVYTDDAYGTAIEITHGDGFVSKYTSLESAAFVEEGDTVRQGKQIGTIGKSARYEALDPAHLHFELHKDGTLCNPADYITFQ